MNKEITRRSVLKGIGVAFGLLLLPDIPIKLFLDKLKSAFDPDREYGSGFEVTEFNIESEDMKFILKLIPENLKKILPPGTPYEIQALAQGDFGRRKTVAWVYSPGMSRDTFNNHGWKYDPQRGYYILGRFLA